MTNDKPKDRSDVCIAWGCTYRDRCAFDIEKHGTVVIRFFLPHHTGEHCEFYTEADEPKSCDS